MKYSIKTKLLIVCLFITFITGCTSQTIQPEPYQSNIGQSCQNDSECKTPMDYLVQSNCPFGSSCIDNRCAVVCPLFHHDPNPEISKSYPDSCQIDSDCDCTNRGVKSLECRCINNSCLSIEAN